MNHEGREKENWITFIWYFKKPIMCVGALHIIWYWVMSRDRASQDKKLNMFSYLSSKSMGANVKL